MAEFLDQLGEIELSAVHEIANIGLGNAATSLSTLLGRTVHIEVPQVSARLVGALAHETLDAGIVTVGVLMPFDGDVEGTMAFFFPWEAAAELWETLIGAKPEGPCDIDEMAASVMIEVGNMVCSGFLNSVAELTNLGMYATPPAMGVDFMESLLATLDVEAELNMRVALTINTRLHGADGSALEGMCLVIPSQEGLVKLLQSLGLEVAA